MKEFDRNDPLWDVMGRVREPEPSPWLAQRVVARVRAEQDVPVWRRILRRLAAGARGPMLAGAAAVMVALAMWQPWTARHPVSGAGVTAAGTEAVQWTAALVALEEEQLDQELASLF
jgi:hypothetical protein